MGIAAGAGRIGRALIGTRFELAPPVLQRYPELRQARYRRGGLPVLVGGWTLGRARVDAITLWRTVFVADGTEPSAELLLHELRHVHQFAESRLFPLRYIWESFRRGYHDNRFERDARRYASRAQDPLPHSKDV